MNYFRSRKIALPLASIMAFATISCNNMNDTKLSAPIAKKQDTVITTHGHERVDQYFWMRLSDEQKNAEKPDAQTQDVLDYLNAENAYLEQEMASEKSLREKLYEEMVGRIAKDDESVPYFKNGFWYYSKFEKDNEYPIYCRKKGSLDSEEEILLDVNELAKDKDYYQVGSLDVSPNNKILAFGEDDVSRRIYTIRFKNLETGEFLDDELKNTTGNVAWANDNQTVFFTTKNKETLLSEKIWRHKLGNDESEMVYHETDPSYYNGVYRSKSGKFIIIYNSSTLSSDYQILSADTPEGDFANFTSREKVHEYSIAHFNDKFYIITNWDAENFRLMECPEKQTDKKFWKEVLAHRPDVLLEDVDIFKNHLVLSERSNALPHLRIINQKTNEDHYIKFVDPAYVAYTGANPEFDTNTLRIMYGSPRTPMSTIDYNMNTKEKEVKKVQKVIGGHNPEEFEVKRVFVKARDGKDVPVTMVHRKDTELKNAPTLLYAYGSYGANIDPYFSSARLSLLNRGFVFAIGHIRGSQSLGRQWYEDGKLLNKKNTFFDFIDCAKYLINEGITSKEHLYAQGGSAGGLLMGAVANMGGEHFNGMISQVPFVDVVNTMLDESIPLTTNEFDEWGNPKIKEYYDYILSYSPYDNVEKKEYPNMLVTTGYFDSQVQYWEPAKWVAKLRDYKTDNNLLIMHCDMEAGHGGASGRFKAYKDIALEYAFLLKLEGIKE